MIDLWVMYAKQIAVTYWNIPMMLAHRDVYIGTVIGAAILLRMAPGVLKVGALVLAFFTPHLYFTYFRFM